VGERYGERKKYRGREKGEKGQLSAQGDSEIKDGRGNGAERERQKKQQEEAGHKDSKRKKGQGSGQRWEKSSGDTRKETEREGHKRIDQDSGRMETQNKTWEGQPGWGGAGQRAGERKNTAVERRRGMEKEREGWGAGQRNREKISDGEKGRALGRGK